MSQSPWFLGYRTGNASAPAFQAAAPNIATVVTAAAPMPRPATRAKQAAPSPAAPAATNIAEVRLVSTSRGITLRQPTAAPARSHAYSRPIGACIRVSASVTAMPDRKNGTLSRITTTASGMTSASRASVSGGTGMTRVVRWMAGMDSASASVERASIRAAASPRARSPRRKTYTAPLAIPSMASDTARKDR